MTHRCLPQAPVTTMASVEQAMATITCQWIHGPITRGRHIGDLKSPPPDPQRAGSSPGQTWAQ
jgi:hypothetical protein